MKIQVTVAEVTELFRAKYDLPAGTSIEIVPNYAVPDSALKVISAVERLRYNSTEKIAAIKAFRCEYNYVGFTPGLAQSKWAVENWTTFKSEVLRIGRLLTDNELGELVRSSERTW